MCVCVCKRGKKIVCVSETDTFYSGNKLIKLKHEIPTFLEIVTLRFIEVNAAPNVGPLRRMKYIYYD